MVTWMRTDQCERDLQTLFVDWNKNQNERAAVAGRPRSISFATIPKAEVP